MWLRKICGCFWKARSDWTVSSVAMIATRTAQAVVGEGGSVIFEVNLEIGISMRFWVLAKKCVLR